MPAEKQNNISDKLDAIHSLPEGYNFHPDKVWKRLEPQLKKTSVNYRAVFFAAACCIAVIIFISLPMKGKDHSAGIGSKAKPAIIPKSNNQFTAIVNSPAEKKSMAEKRTPKSPAHNLAKPELKQQLPADVVIHPAVNLPKQEEKMLPEINTQVQAIVAVKQKHRFPIAHVNELNTSVIVERDVPVTKSITTFAFRKHSVEVVPSPVSSFEEGFTDRKKSKSIFPLFNSAQ